ncbi:Mannosyl-oligosaccharide 1,2-alpha-mannosidase MNS3 [Hypsizygus marmoreus]|uniref:alpha-1,2-Mannosidase n=1 Tax=Hypsizygus marmoreus TaxID=39966 RepID=A0A369JY89_HYPMA|nr:Mannosyl-oligosaccharide 1,2-alpha-mannosidase MNS3 [Hypsizygus marmoreus]
MAEPALRQRKNGTPADEQKANGTTKPNVVGGKGKGSPSKYATGLIGLVAFVFAALLYRSDYFLRQHVAPELETTTRLPADLQRRDAVVQAFKHAWSGYERDAMGDDQYHPISKKGTNLTDAGGIGYTIVDAIDTMQIMGLTEEYTRARAWIEKSLSFDRNGKFNTFEITIRILGGLLSAYHLCSGDPLYLEKATELADRLLPAFETPFGLPATDVNLGLRKAVEDANNVASTAEVGSVQLELRYLSHLTDNDEYWDKAENVMKTIKAATLPSGLATIYMGTESGQFLMSQIRLGSRGDSFYEYLLKQYLQTNQTETGYRELYENAMTAIHKTLLRTTPAKNLTFFVELVPQRGRRGKIDWHAEPKQDHLVCFLGGNLMLGATTAGADKHSVSVPPMDDELSPTGQRDWKTGMDVIETCIETYKGTATGLSPEIVHFRTSDDGLGSTAKTDWYIKGARGSSKEPPYDARYILRPETIESLFVAYRLTGDEKYRQYGWDIFQAIEKYCRVETGGYASILNVDDVNSKLEDRMETFMLSETLKYLYLLFSDESVLPLDKYVFNTEAHPLPIFTPQSRRPFT